MGKKENKADMNDAATITAIGFIICILLLAGTYARTDQFQDCKEVGHTTKYCLEELMHFSH